METVAGKGRMVGWNDVRVDVTYPNSRLVLERIGIVGVVG